MGKISFRLNKGKRILDKNKPQSIYVRFIIDQYSDFNASTGMIALESDWNSVSMEMKNRTSIPNRYEINSHLRDLNNHLEQLNISSVLNGKKLDYVTVKDHFLAFKNRNKHVTEQSFFSFLEDFIESARTKPNHFTKQLVAKSTLQVYSRTKEILQQYSEQNGKLDFDNIDMDFYHDFIEWCQALDYSQNYIGKLIKTLKTFLSEATEQGINQNLVFQSKRFGVLTEESSSIYLSTQELEMIANLKLESDLKLSVTRDLFLIGAYTGLRVSDFNSLTEGHIRKVNGKDLIQIKTKKTGAVVAIPLHPVVKSIIQNNHAVFDVKISEIELNRILKSIGDKAGITSPEETVITKGGKLQTSIVKKFELITTHTARRSFCTNTYLMGMDPIDIRSISGHKTEKAFLLYIKSTPQERALKMSEHRFFN